MLENYEKKVLTVKEKKIKLNAPLKGFEAGHEILIKCDNSGIPLDRYWRDRLKDAQIDNCIEFVKENKGSKK